MINLIKKYGMFIWFLLDDFDEWKCIIKISMMVNGISKNILLSLFSSVILSVLLLLKLLVKIICVILWRLMLD